MEQQRCVRSNSDLEDNQQHDGDEVPTLTSPIDKQPSKKKSLYVFFTTRGHNSIREIISLNIKAIRLKG